MTSLTRRGPYANAPARLPGIQTARITDANVRQAVESLREWVEVRLGARGDRFERAVTFRDFDYQLELLRRNIDDIETTLRSYTGAQVGDTNTSAPTSDVSKTVSSLQSQVTALQTDLASFKTTSSNTDTQHTQRLGALEAQVTQLAADVLALSGNNQTNNVVEVQIDGSVVVPPAVSDAVYLIYLTTNVTVYPPNNAVSGHRYIYVFEQDGTGGRTVTFSPTFKFADSLSSIVSSQPATVSVVETVYYDGAQFDNLYVTNFRTYSSVSPITGFAGALSASSFVGAGTHAADAQADGTVVSEAFTGSADAQAAGVATPSAVGVLILSGAGAAIGLATVVGSRA